MAHSNNDTDSVLEILDAGSRADWDVAPGRTAELRISIRNGTQDSHDIEVSVADPIDWIRVIPARIALVPGDEAMTTLVIAIPPDAPVASGEHTVTLELHDFEGTSFGQLVSSVNVQPVYRLEMSVAVREPLVRRDVVEGFILQCTLVNRGNAEVAAETRDDGAGCISLHAPGVRVPMGGQISFDVEARWTSAQLRVYPATIGVRAVYDHGEAAAHVPWIDVVKCLGQYIPPLHTEEEFPEILPRRSTHLDGARAADEAEAAQTSASASIPEPLRSRAPIRVQINGPSPYRSAYGRRINPWWPPSERLGGRWRVKMLPLVTAFVLTASAAIVAGYRPNDASGLTPLTNLMSALHSSLQNIQSRHLHSIVALTGANARVPRHLKPADVDDLPRLPVGRQNSGPSVWTPAGASQPRRPAPKGSVWQGPVLHVSSSNIKVYSSTDKAARSFIVTPDFKSVYSADGLRVYAMSDVRAGAIVRVFYSYTFGVRHPNAIYIIRRTGKSF